MTLMTPQRGSSKMDKVNQWKKENIIQHQDRGEAQRSDRIRNIIEPHCLSVRESTQSVPFSKHKKKQKKRCIASKCEPGSGLKPKCVITRNPMKMMKSIAKNQNQPISHRMRNAENKTIATAPITRPVDVVIFPVEESRYCPPKMANEMVLQNSNESSREPVHRMSNGIDNQMLGNGHEQRPTAPLWMQQYGVMSQSIHREDENPQIEPEMKIEHSGDGMSTNTNWMEQMVPQMELGQTALQQEDVSDDLQDIAKVTRNESNVVQGEQTRTQCYIENELRNVEVSTRQPILRAVDGADVGSKPVLRQRIESMEKMIQKMKAKQTTCTDRFTNYPETLKINQRHQASKSSNGCTSISSVWTDQTIEKTLSKQFVSPQQFVSDAVSGQRASMKIEKKADLIRNVKEESEDLLYLQQQHQDDETVSMSTMLEALGTSSDAMHRDVMTPNRLAYQAVDQDLKERHELCIGSCQLEQARKDEIRNKRIKARQMLSFAKTQNAFRSFPDLNFKLF